MVADVGLPSSGTRPTRWQRRHPLLAAPALAQGVHLTIPSVTYERVAAGDTTLEELLRCIG